MFFLNVFLCFVFLQELQDSDYVPNEMDYNFDGSTAELLDELQEEYPIFVSEIKQAKQNKNSKQKQKQNTQFSINAKSI